MRLVNQRTAAPTRKLTASTLSASLAGIIQAAVVSRWPDFADPVIWAPLPILVGFVVGYFVRERG